VNLVGDVVNAIRGDLRSLIGVPVAIVLIVYLTRRRAVLAACVVLTLSAPAIGVAGVGAFSPPRTVVLSEGWLFQPDPLGVGEARHWESPGLDRKGWRSVVVPMAWDEYDGVMDGYEGIGWYALSLPADRIVPNAWQRLHFGRANHRATVWIDGMRAGENLTGYLPFEVPASPFLKPGRSAWIVVRVENGTRYDWLPGMETVEWVQYGGLLEPVELLTTAPTFIRRVAVRAAPRGAESGGDVRAAVEVENTAATPFMGRVRLEVDGRESHAEIRVAARSSASATLALSVPEARLWSLEDPRLYDARILLFDRNGRGELDSVAERFGVRSIDVAGREIRLNGRSLRPRGVNRYDEFPRHGPVVDEATIRADLLAVRRPERISCARTTRSHPRTSGSPTRSASSTWRRCR
jgi:beta-galactosidase/beta-glucuronidase